MDLDKKFITVIPNNRLEDIDYINDQVIKNRLYSLEHRQEIHEYSRKFEWENIFNNYYFPSIEKIISRHHG